MRYRTLTQLLWPLVTAVGLQSQPGAAGDTVNAIKTKGYIQCGVNTGLTGFAMPDSRGTWQGFDIDFCRAVAAAVFGDAGKVRFSPLSAQQRFTALQSGEVDLLARNTTHTLQRDGALGIHFTAPNYYDGQAFMVHKNLGVKSALELSGATVCVAAGTTTELNLADYFRAHKMSFKPVVIENKDELTKAFFAQRCDCYTTDGSGLAAERSKAAKPDDYIILPENISKEPLALAVRHGDDQWYDIVSWTLWAMINAEELDVTSKNVNEMRSSPNPRIRRLLGTTPGMGAALGLDEKWAYNIIRQVGNYAEVYERHLGKNSPLGLPRGLNQLWTKGGILYAPPIR